MIANRTFNFPYAQRYNPFAEMERMDRQMVLLSDAVFGRSGRGWFSAKVFPAVNIAEDKNKYFVRAELPGMSADEINLQVHGRNLMISGERKIKSEGENARYHRREREAGRFSRAVTLPGDIDADSVKARMINGMLMVEIAKSEASKPKQITVN